MKSFSTSVYLLIFLFSWFFTGEIHAQNPSQIDVLGTADGLLFRDVSDIVQDNNSLLWIGTRQGLNRYDGINFKAYTSDKQNPFFIEEDFILTNIIYDASDNSVWFIANYRLFKLNISEDSILAFDAKGLLNNRILEIYQSPDNTIWVVTDNHNQSKKQNPKLYLKKLENGKFNTWATTDKVSYVFNNLTFDVEGFVWWATTNGTYKYSPKGELLENHLLDTYDWNGDDIHYLPQFFDSHNKHYYFPPSRGGIDVYDEKTRASETIFKTKEIIRRAIEDTQGSIWFASDTALYRMDANGHFNDYTLLLKSKLDYSKINNLFIDKNSLLWIATDNGLFKVRTQKQLFENLFKSTKEGWGHSMRGICEDADGRLFSLCETKHQLWYKTKTGQLDSLPLTTTFGKPLNLMYDASFIVTDSSQTKAYAIGNGICEIDLKTGYTKIHDQFKDYNNIHGPNPLVRLRDGRLLFGFTTEHLTVFDPETLNHRAVFQDSLKTFEIRNLDVFEESRDKDCVWIGTRGHGIIKVHLSGKIIQSYDHNFSSKIGKNPVLCIEEDIDKSIWIGTYGGGLTHLSHDGKAIINYDKNDGLPDDNVVAILPEGPNKLWIATYNGLSLFNKITKEFQNFYTEDGLSHNEFNFSSFYKNSEGQFYLGGMNGINAFFPNEIETTQLAPEIKFVGLNGYNGRHKNFYKLDYAQKPPKQIVVSPYDQYIELHWMMPSYFQNEKNSFSTKLEGFEERWFYQGHSSSVRYNKLPAGEYVLKVKGTDARGNQSASILSVPITVRQIFYKQWWFLALIILVFLGIAYSIFRYRLRQVLAMERLRTRISSDLHDDVGSLLSGLAMQTELLEANANEQDKKRLHKIASISRNAVSQMRDLVWSIDSRRETVADLIERMRELAEELLLPRDIAFQLNDVEIKNPQKKLQAQTKQHLFLIYKEAINNIVKHSDATSVNVKIINTGRNCQFSIKDNGSKKKAYKSTGLGLANMKMRAEQLEAKLDFNHSDGFGIYLELPFQM
ncbi:MAG: two-component regulator propeller domain-containing protein [Bacteroidota bacterium]